MDRADKNRFRRGVGMVLVNGDKKIFAGRKTAFNAKMMCWFLEKPWQMPQGGIENEETPIEAALRELKEEIGTNKVELIAEAKVWIRYIIPSALRRKEALFIGQRQKWFLLKFLGNDKDINLNYSGHAEFDIWRWMSLSNIIRLSVHFKRTLYLNVFKEFKWYFDQE